MSDNRKIKIKVEDLTLIFGKRKKDALQLPRQGVSKEEILKRTKCTVGVNRASFEIKEREIFVIMGLSGSGKSTLIRCLNRLSEPTDGKVIFDNHDITRDTNKRMDCCYRLETALQMGE
jgi:glycine betaine/proline transport system ATP-binding protein